MLNLLELVFVGIFLAGLWLLAPPLALMVGGLAGVVTVERVSARTRRSPAKADTAARPHLRRVA